MSLLNNCHNFVGLNGQCLYKINKKKLKMVSRKYKYTGTAVIAKEVVDKWRLKNVDHLSERKWAFKTTYFLLLTFDSYTYNA